MSTSHIGRKERSMGFFIKQCTENLLRKLAPYYRRWISEPINVISIQHYEIIAKALLKVLQENHELFKLKKMYNSTEIWAYPGVITRGGIQLAQYRCIKKSEDFDDEELDMIYQVLYNSIVNHLHKGDFDNINSASYCDAPFLYLDSVENNGYYIIFTIAVVDTPSTYQYVLKRYNIRNASKELFDGYGRNDKDF